MIVNANTTADSRLGARVSGLLRVHLCLVLFTFIPVVAAVYDRKLDANTLLYLWIGLMALVAATGIGLAAVGLRAANRPAVAAGAVAPVVSAALLFLSYLALDNHGFDYFILFATLASGTLLTADLRALLVRPSAAEPWRGGLAPERQWVRVMRTLAKLHAAGTCLAFIMLTTRPRTAREDSVSALWLGLVILLIGLSGTLARLGWRGCHGRTVVTSVLVTLILAAAPASLVFVAIDDPQARLPFWSSAGWHHSEVLLFLILAAAVLIADIWMLAGAPKPLAESGAIPRGSTASRGRSSASVVPEAIRDCLVSHEPYRLSHRILGPALSWGYLAAPIAFGFALLELNARFELGLEDFEHRLGIWALIAVLFFVWASRGGAVHQYVRDRLGYKVARERGAEEALIELLESGREFGLYLRPFSEGRHSREVLKVLRAFQGCPFFALDDVRQQTPKLIIPEIWVPMAKWERVALPLMQEATVIVFDLTVTDVERPASANAGLVQELSFAVEKGLTHKSVLLIPPTEPAWSGVVGTSSWRQRSRVEDYWGDRIGELARVFPSRLAGPRFDRLPAHLEAIFRAQ
jgi:hypothetical protein